MYQESERSVELLFNGVRFVGTVRFEPNPYAAVQVRTMVTEGLVQSIAKGMAEGYVE